MALYILQAWSFVLTQFFIIIWLVDLVYGLKFLFLFFDVPLWYCYISHWSSVNSYFSFGDISFFRYFFIIIICNCLWIILLWILQNFPNSINNFIGNIITISFFWFLNYSSWSSFKCISSSLFSMIKTIFTTYVFTYILLTFLPIFLAKDKNP